MKSKNVLVRKITPGLFPIDSVKVLPSPDPEVVRENLTKYRSMMSDIDYEEMIRRLHGETIYPK